MSLARSALADRRLDDVAGRAGRFALGQGVDELHAFDHLAPDRVLAVQVGGGREADEELAVGAVGIGVPSFSYFKIKAFASPINFSARSGSS